MSAGRAVSSIPTILIGDVTGNPNHTYAAMREYFNSRFSNQHFAADGRINTFSNSTKISIQTQASEIAKQVLTNWPEQKQFQVIAFSFGGHVAAMLAQILIEQGKFVSLCILDTPKTQLAANHLVNPDNRFKVTLQVLQIIKRIAVLRLTNRYFGADSPYSDEASYTDENLKPLINKARGDLTLNTSASDATTQFINNLFQIVTTEILNQAELNRQIFSPSESIEGYKFLFERACAIAKFNLLSLADMSEEKLSPTPSSVPMCLIKTKQTQELYFTPQTHKLKNHRHKLQPTKNEINSLGWSKNLENIEIIEFNASSQHLDVVSSQYAAHTCKLIDTYFDSCNQAFRDKLQTENSFTRSTDDDEDDIDNNSPMHISSASPKYPISKSRSDSLTLITLPNSALSFPVSQPLQIPHGTQTQHNANNAQMDQNIDHPSSHSFNYPNNRVITRTFIKNSSLSGSNSSTPMDTSTNNGGHYSPPKQ